MADMRRKLAIFESSNKVFRSCNLHVINEKQTINMNRSLLVLLLAGSVVACTPGSDEPNLSGCWVRDDAKSIECWSASGDTLHGQGLQVNGHGDTTVFERLMIYTEGETRIYAARVGQSENFIEYRETSPWVFENPEHDFPKKIAYEFISPSEVYVSVGEGEEAFGWRFKKDN